MHNNTQTYIRRDATTCVSAKRGLRHKLLCLCALTLILASCTNDDDFGKTAPLTLDVPVELVVSNMPVDGARAMGDPGMDGVLPPPANIYVFAWMQISSGQWNVYCGKTEGLTAGDWEYTAGEDADFPNSRYLLKKNVPVKFGSSSVTGAGDLTIGRIYAIAANRKFTDEQLRTMLGAYSDAVGSSMAIQVSASPDATLQAVQAVFDSDWKSADYRDLYSTPAADTNVDENDENKLTNGEIKYIAADNAVKQGHIRLYHVAAKYDFTWEIDADLQSATSVNSITVTGLPTVCNIFKPTTNTAGTAQLSLTTADGGINTGNKWIGRECIYGLQRADATLNYTVTFAGTANRPQAERTFTPANPNTIFTGWYRVLATVAR